MYVIYQLGTIITKFSHTYLAGISNTIFLRIPQKISVNLTLSASSSDHIHPFQAKYVGKKSIVPDRASPAGLNFSTQDFRI